MLDTVSGIPESQVNLYLLSSRTMTDFFDMKLGYTYIQLSFFV